MAGKKELGMCQGLNEHQCGGEVVNEEERETR